MINLQPCEEIPSKKLVSSTAVEDQKIEEEEDAGEQLEVQQGAESEMQQNHNQKQYQRR